MERHGFVRSELELKTLILFALRCAACPVAFDNLSDMIRNFTLSVKKVSKTLISVRTILRSPFANIQKKRLSSLCTKYVAKRILTLIW